MSATKANQVGPGTNRRRYANPLDRGIWMFVLPLIAFLTVFYAFPVLAMLWRSVSDPTFSLAHYATIFSEPVFLRIFWLSFKIATVVTLITLFLAYPLAYVIATTSNFVSRVLMGLVLVPFWISVLVRTYAWMVLLGRDGFINDILLSLGFVSQPVRMLNTTFSTYVGMVHVLLPFMVLPLYASLRSIDRNLIRAADGLGAQPFVIFRRIILPLSLPGVAAGCLLVFVLALGFYVTPALLGSSHDLMISILIGIHVDLFDWGLASALAAVLLVVTLLIVAVFNRFAKLETVLGGGR